MVTDVETLTDRYEIRTQTSRAYEFIHQAILSGKFQPGMQLREHALCHMSGLTRTPIRHAFAKLTAEGLVEQIPNVGRSFASSANARLSN